MGRELQKKKNKSSISKVKHKRKSNKKRVNPLGNALVTANWDSTKTLSQNYQRLGLVARVNTITGGTEHKASKTSTSEKLAIQGHNPMILATSEARVERDPKTGKILRVIHSASSRRKTNPLNDPLMSSDDEDMDTAPWDAEKGDEGEDENEDNGHGIVKDLEAQAALVPEKKERKQSQREKEWVERLVKQYGEDTRSMSRDMKLNPMQQTEADVARRIRRWREGGGTVEI